MCFILQLLSYSKKIKNNKITVIPLLLQTWKFYSNLNSVIKVLF